MDSFIARLEEAMEGSALTDRDIAMSLEEKPCIPFTTALVWGADQRMFWVIGSEDTKDGAIEKKWSKTAPCYTTSLDAKLPGENIVNVNSTAFGWSATHMDENRKQHFGHAKTEPLARRVAALKARKAENE